MTPCGSSHLVRRAARHPGSGNAPGSQRVTVAPPPGALRAVPAPVNGADGLDHGQPEARAFVVAEAGDVRAPEARTGPITGGTREENTASIRVSPPSTGST
jgi:hypothetical protein